MKFPCVSVCLSVCLSVCPSVCLSVCLSHCLFVSLHAHNIVIVALLGINVLFEGLSFAFIVTN